MLKKVSGRWVHVDVTLEDEVLKGPREVVFKSRVKDITIQDAADPTRMEGHLGTLQIELEGRFSESKLSKVYIPTFLWEMARLLDINEGEAEDLLRALCDQTGAYYIQGNYVLRV